MSIVPLALNLALMTLLTAALVFGWRLERRLKALKDSHDSFARAVADLDVAAARAEQGLADLRAATDEAAETLSDRIETARALSGRLERGVTQSDQPRAAVVQVEARPARERSVEEFVRSEPATTPRSRARVDDDLFEPDADAGRLRAIPGGRR
jgi:hypothetical protein